MFSSLLISEQPVQIGVRINNSVLEKTNVKEKDFIFSGNFFYIVKILNFLPYSDMTKQIFSTEFEINTSPKTLFEYLNTAEGLAKWFADDVIFEGDKNYIFVWDEEKHPAKKVGKKENQYVKYEFLPVNGESKEEVSYIEFFVEVNEFTNTTFVRIVDFGEIDDVKDYEELYNHMVTSLTEILGGSNVG